jgi:uncharacterized protein (DUF2147 family)
MRLALLAAAVTFSASAAAAAPDPVVGEWLSQDGAGKIALAPCSSNPALLCGAITWVDPKRPQKDIHNPDPSLRTRPIVGVMVVKDMKNQGPGNWSGGKVYDPESGKTYNGKVRAISTDKVHLDGCVLMVCQSQTWTRTTQ